ncbi:hypothetical protein [Micromonospora avicenniae]|uniref:Uncharacterized protein n=1 Tax=Micromonospora avicenniae TaxID=1198245 RepID=A0A1N6WUL2_9ACTN|nr:hypothetical protein [Micromonospora avicenniae]SIQ93701.1 hypothetical protein SAMN05444858_105112 [Micromonospora avicenniae]
MQAQRSAPPVESSQTSEDAQVSGTTGPSTPLSIWAAATLLGRIDTDEDDIEDERHILRGFE